MHLKNITGVNTIAGLPIITISSDGYMRLSFEELQQIPLVHLMSGLDEDEPTFTQEGATFAEITGYTEWVSTTNPTVSIGWDWEFHSSTVGKLFYKRSSEPRSNIMLVDDQQCDLGSERTENMLESHIDNLAWQITVQDYISSRYAS